MKISIDGNEIEFEGKPTLLDVARENGIPIPSLCDHPRLIPFSGCRLCLVQIKGRSGFLPACSTDCEDGMVVKTQSPRIRRLRKQILELILSEHPNACLICREKESCDDFKSTIRKVGEVTGCVLCPNNGRCELQALVSELGLDRVGFPSRYRDLEVRRSDPFFDRNYNLCILCGRCVRICREVRGPSILTFIQRGPDTVIGAAMDRPMLEAGCQFCGACVDVCPTGALTEKSMKYEGLPEAKTRSICPLCSLGCRMEVNTRGNRVLYSRPADDGPVNRGQACVKGRFLFKEVVHSPRRINRPLVRKRKEWEETDWETALALIAERLKTYRPEQIALVESAQSSCEEAYVIRRLAADILKTKNLLRPQEFSPIGMYSRLLTGNGLQPSLNHDASALAEADTIVMLGSGIVTAQPLVWLEVLQAVRQGAELIVASPARNPIVERFASAWHQLRPGSELHFLTGLSRFLEMRDDHASGEDRPGGAEFAAALESLDLEELIRETGLGREALEAMSGRLAAARAGVFLFGAETAARPDGDSVLTALWNLGLQIRGRLIPLGLEANERGLLELDRGMDRKWAPAEEVIQKISDKTIKALYLTGPLKLPSRSKPEFLVVQSSHWNEAAEAAHVVLPAASFGEEEGIYVNPEGRIQHSRKILESPKDVRPGWWILTGLAQQWKRPGWAFSKTGDIWKDIRAELSAFKKVTAKFIRHGGEAHILESSPGKLRYLEFEPPGSAPRATKKYPLLLVHAADPDSYRGLPLSQEDKGFRLLREESGFRLNPEDAARYELQEGDDITVKSPMGTWPGKARFDENAMPGTLFSALAAFRFTDQRAAHVLPVELKRGS
jgi:predicted molibdopterin-dependent oxidoreductase YjgC